MNQSNEPFEVYKADFKRLTSKEWSESLSDYLLFIQWKVQEQQLVAQNELCARVKIIETKISSMFK
jgi:hypothetical protein